MLFAVTDFVIFVSVLPVWFMPEPIVAGGSGGPMIRKPELLPGAALLLVVVPTGVTVVVPAQLLTTASTCPPTAVELHPVAAGTTE